MRSEPDSVPPSGTDAQVGPWRVPDAVTTPLRVVYVAGTGRSGTTLLGNAVGSLPGAVSVGEVKYGFGRTLADDGPCGCRRPVRHCPVWQPALEETFGRVPDPAQARELDARLSALVRTRQVPWWIAGRHSDEADELVDLMGRLMVALARAAGATTVVDSSKLPAYGALLARSPLLDVRVVHVVRDPRAVAWSWQRRSASQEVVGFESAMEQISPAKASLMWLESSVSVAGLARSGGGHHPLEVRYEDLVGDPARELGRVAAHAGLEPDLSFVGPDGLDLRESHAITGNPNRVRSGTVALHHDDEWSVRLPAAQRRLVSTLTAPRRRAHGY